MAVEVALGSPLADALNSAIQPKLVEVGWAQNSGDSSQLSEYVILMLVNGKTQDQIAAELSSDLLSLSPDDPSVLDFTKWLFDEIDRVNGTSTQHNNAAGTSQDDVVAMEQDTDMASSTDSPELNAPTGPKSMRNGNGAMRGGREKRMFGQMAKAMDRSHDSVLHRVRSNGNERVNAHNRAPPTGPRGGRGNNRAMNNRAAGIAHGLNQMPNMAGMPGPMGGNPMNDMSWMMQGGGQQEQIFNLLQQQNQMMAQLQQQLTQQNQNGGRQGRSLFERTHRGGRRGGHHPNHRGQQNESGRANEGGAEGEDVDMGQSKSELPNPETTVCKYNLTCGKQDCKFAHQSPAAPPHTTVDVSDICTYGAACKNFKCVGRHPSPATRRAHQNEQECKFYPNCTNPRCPFKHPDMPPCRNGGDCSVEGCKFTHVQTMCKFKPCKNRFCHFKHEEGQRGTFGDKVWTADGAKEHVSERKFADENGGEELRLIALLRSVYSRAQHETLQSACHRPMARSKLPWARQLRPVAALHVGLRRPIGRLALIESPRRVFSTRKQSFATETTSKEAPRQIAVLGGGITGLTAAHYLARHATNAHITLYEASGKLGGWVDAEKVPVGQGRDEHVLLQHGPRMLRSGGSSNKYDDLVLYDVLINLNMTDQLQQPSSIAEDRYIYYPDRLVKLPSPTLSFSNIIHLIRSYFTEPLYDGALRAARKINELQIQRFRDEPFLEDSPAKLIHKDESLGAWLTRIMDDARPVKNVVSGIMHGIYGGDVNKLSAKNTMLDRLWYSLTLGKPPGAMWMFSKDCSLLADMMGKDNHLKIIEMAERCIDWKLLVFEDGLMSLVDGLANDLKKCKNVTIKYNAPVTSLSHEFWKVLVTAGEATQPSGYDHVISTLFSKQMAEITQSPLPPLAETHAVTIMVVNLWYPNPDLLKNNHGFGYLIPTSTPDNDECALGVLFDSDIQTGTEVPGTKLTVMLGGHYWDDWKFLPTEETAVAMAKSVVQKHLGISETEEVVASSRLCQDCLPQHFVGHRQRMKEAHASLWYCFKGQLKVAGPSYTTIGVIPSMRAGFDAAMRVATGQGPPWFRAPGDLWETLLRVREGDHPVRLDHVGETGLGWFMEDEWSTMRVCQQDSMPFRKFTGEEFRHFNEEDVHNKICMDICTVLVLSSDSVI
ncbi:hypothetical protein F5Y15DRAFT_408823 [Xylariaceae sp. FL0016]|nr:hypothetical protein F5Y15DRAFT_408823 [Xylariaceae sp. FL0016]